MNKLVAMEKVQEEEYQLYKLKNVKYGDAYKKLRDEYKDKFPIILIRLEDKLSRLKTLMLNGQDGSDTDESLEDTLKDLANYANMELVEMRYDKGVYEHDRERDS